jgi:hypothetical protein
MSLLMPRRIRPIRRRRSRGRTLILLRSRSRIRRHLATHIPPNQVLPHLLVPHVYVSIPLFSPRVLLTLHRSLLLRLVFAYALGQATFARIERREALRRLFGQTVTVHGVVVGAERRMGRMLQGRGLAGQWSV